MRELNLADFNKNRENWEIFFSRKFLPLKYFIWWLLWFSLLIVNYSVDMLYKNICSGQLIRRSGDSPVRPGYIPSRYKPLRIKRFPLNIHFSLGYIWAEDKEHCEEYGRMLQADPSKVSLKAKKRGLPQVITNFSIIILIQSQN